MINNIDVSEDDIFCRFPELLDALLKDHTMSRDGRQQNIFWATRDYEHLGDGYGYADPILPRLLTGYNGRIIMPRNMKTRVTQRVRSREMAEVFTPSWICNAQNNLIDEAWFGRKDVFNHENDDHTWTVFPEKIVFPAGKTWRHYVRDTRLEITCGEAPYLVSRYDAASGESIPLDRRIGLLDRKLRVVGENTTTSGEWLRWAQTALKSIYAYEWQGDNLFVARENILMTFADHYKAKFGREPLPRSLQYAAYIISWNLWQMDGLKCVVPDSCGVKPAVQLSLFGEPEMQECEGCRTGDMRRHNGTYCMIRDWGARKPKDRIRFVDLIRNDRL